MKKYDIDKNSNGKKYKRGRDIFGLSIFLGIIGIVFLILGMFVQDFKHGLHFAAAGAVVSMIAALILMYKSYSDMMAYESSKMEEEYENNTLYKLSSICKEDVRTKLLAAGFEEEGDFLKKKKFSYLKDSITYYFKLVDVRKVYGNIERSISEFELLDRSGNSCLCLFVYLDELTDEDLEGVKEFDKMQIVYENIINPFTQDGYVLVAVDKNTNDGYFLDIGKKHKTSLYAHGCKWIKRILEN